MVQLSRTRLVASEFKVQESSVNYVGVNGSISYVLIQKTRFYNLKMVGLHDSLN